MKIRLSHMSMALALSMIIISVPNVDAGNGHSSSRSKYSVVIPTTESLLEAVKDKNINLVRNYTELVDDINCSDFQGCTPLLWAAIGGDKTIAQLLLDKGAQVNLPNNEGNTPLHMAVIYGRTDIVKLLLQHGADSTIKNKTDNTALQIANQFGFGNNEIHHLLR